MSTLSPGAILAYCLAAGWRGQDALDAMGVALAESSGNTETTSANPDGGTNVGLFQLDTPGGVGHGYSIAQLKNPALNAQVAHAGWVKDGKTFAKHWATWPEPAKTRQLEAVRKDITLPSLVNVGTDSLFLPGSPGDVLTKQQQNAQSSSSGTDSNPLTQISKILAWVSTPANWGRIALVVVGGGLVIAGLNQIAKPVTAPVVGVAKKAAPVARKLI